MNKKILFLPLIGCTLLSSCVGEDTNETIEVPKVIGGRSITFEVEPLSVETKSLSTKVNVVPTPTSDGLEWTNEEVSFLFYESDEKQLESPFTVTVTNPLIGSPTVSMTGERPATEGNYHVIAISPANENHFAASDFTTILEISQPQTQNGSTYAHLSDNIFLYSHSSTLLKIDAGGDVDGTFPLQFNPLNALVRFDIVNKSTKQVTLNKITIKLGGDGKLFTTAKLHVGNGSLEYSNDVTEMTLNLSDASINGNATSPFIAYMAAWKSNTPAALEIKLNITPEGETARDLIYDLDNVLFEEGVRTHIELDIEAGDVLLNVEDNIGEEVINSLTYKTYTYTPPSGHSITWMMTNNNYNSTRDGYEPYARNCPSSWKAPSSTQVTELRAHFVSNPAIIPHFYNAIQGPSYYYSNDNTSWLPASSNKHTITSASTSSQTWPGGTTAYRSEGFGYSLTSSDPVSPISYNVVNPNVWYVYPVRCVKLS